MSKKEKEDITLDDMFPKEHISGHDLGEKAFVVTIRDYVEKMVYNQRKRQATPVWTLWFEEAKKPLVLNITMGEAVVEIAGSRLAADWVGKKVELYAEWIKAFGKKHFVVRIREVTPAGVSARVGNGETEFDEAKQAYYDYALGVEGMTSPDADLWLGDHGGDYDKALKAMLPEEMSDEE